MRYERLQPLNIDPDMLQERTVAVVGLGATGSHMAETLARIGVNLVLVDRDFLEPSNLSTSTLYTEDQVEQRLPKAIAAEEQTSRITTDIEVAAHIRDVNHRTVETLMTDVDLILDGTDNMETRFLLNEYSLKTETPWVHVSALGYTGEVMPIVPGKTACFRCIFADVDPAGLETCETAGILKETAATAANHATMTAARILTGDTAQGLTRFNLDRGKMRTLTVEQRKDCSVCMEQQYPYLEGNLGSTTVALCGQDKYQIRPPHPADIELKTVDEALQEKGTVVRNNYLLRMESDDVMFTLFQDGRAIIKAASAEEAKTIYSRFVGN